VLVCANCGRESEGDFAFCPHCAAPLKALEPSREQRKTVTVLFCDITGSTALGEATDPEALRALLARYFERMKSIVELHGGTVEKFIGDAVMAVFGVPQVHEDDALRACRAAVEMRAALPELGLQARIGLNTGEVMTGTEERLATGDAVNVAARLEQAAQPGEILIGAETLSLVRDAVETETVEPLELKGKAEAVPAHCLLAVIGEPERRHESRFVGRNRELDVLREAWERAQFERSCQLVTLIGDAGVGKSRLAAELLSSLEIHTVSGRCLSYGEGITYSPVVGVVKQLGALPSDAAAATSLRSLLGETEQATSAEEIAWAFRKLLEEQAPLVCVFEDIHWAEETFLDLVEHVALLSSGAAILLLCLARPELVERRPQWPAPLRLEPLAEQDVDELLAPGLDPELRARISRASGGNPLFLTEMAAMAREAAGDVAVPPTLKALLAARLDQLEGEERQVLERGAVEGEVFHRGAVQALSHDGQVTPKLAALVRRELIRPDTSQLAAEDAFRFRHLLIRDTAYQALPKAARAELHERFAGWLEERGADLVELDEILGYHLERAAQYRQELGQADLALVERAGDRLAAAGRRALWRGDFRASAPLLGRALELLRPIGLDVALELDLAEAHARLSNASRAAALADAVAERAQAESDLAGEALARAVAVHHRLSTADVNLDELDSLARVALPLLEEAEDHAGLVHLWAALSEVAFWRGRNEEAALAAEQAVRNGFLAGQHRARLFGLGGALALGPRPADEALRTLETVGPPIPDTSTARAQASLLAMVCRFGEAWATVRQADERALELTGNGIRETHAEIARLAGDYEDAAHYGLRDCNWYQEHGERAYLATAAPLLGRTLCVLGRYDEAERWAQLGREWGDEQDVATQMLWRQVQALVCAHRGEHAEAERLARESVHVTEATDGLNDQGDAYFYLAKVLADANRPDNAAEALEQALDRYGRKKNLAMVAQVKPKLEELRTEAVASPAGESQAAP
jgi:class 3 adenylate cyclase